MLSSEGYIYRDYSATTALAQHERKTKKSCAILTNVNLFNACFYPGLSVWFQLQWDVQDVRLEGRASL